jgi:uncharacterized protein (DUF952 family)
MKYLIFIGLIVCFTGSALGKTARICLGNSIVSAQPVYKILREHEWREFQFLGSFSGSKDDLRDGFIHLSPADQVERIIKKYFATDPPIYIVKFNNVDFLKRLVWEPASNGDLYPHLYNTALSLDEIDSVELRKQ